MPGHDEQPYASVPGDEAATTSPREQVVFEHEGNP